ncbi:MULTISPECIES: LysM peptidoglycan-binding domain-containing M23 family metallopeptidase [Thermus]|uniref:LysM peptidoglycan-binding domain-containing M23 family metallopeptidase n=1 Tax=Thermus TaxID=270 RepID=UPI001F1C7033|nr:MULTISPECIES: M23 family metallopeptidase [Thermus]
MPRFLPLAFFVLLAMAQVHTVAPGETLYGIARRYGVRVEDLARWNGLSDPNRIRAGQVLWVGLWEVPLPRGRLWASFPVQGRAFGLRVEGYGAGEVAFLGVRYPLAPGKGGLWGLLAVGALVEPGEYPLRLFLDGEEKEVSLKVAPGGYGQEALALTPGLEALLKDPGVKAERERVVAACPKEGPLAFAQAFRPPLEGGRITSPFGTRRRYGHLFASYHEGLDFAAPLGTPVRAVAEGVVVLSERLKVRGEAVVLAHGMGLCTGYWHLKERRVRVGERVKAGEVLGLLGSTGLSTGPHLHLEVRLQGVPVDPAPFFHGLPLP